MNKKEIENLTPETYQGKVEKNDRMCYHVRIEKVTYSPNTGEKLSRPTIQKFGIKAWGEERDTLVRLGYKIDVLFDPVEYQKTVKHYQDLLAKKVGDLESKNEDLKKAEKDLEKLEAALTAAIKEEAEADESSKDAKAKAREKAQKAYDKAKEPVEKTKKEIEDLQAEIKDAKAKLQELK